MKVKDWNNEGEGKASSGQGNRELLGVSHSLSFPPFNAELSPRPLANKPCCIHVEVTRWAVTNWRRFSVRGRDHVTPRSGDSRKKRSWLMVELMTRNDDPWLARTYPSPSMAPLSANAYSRCHVARDGS